ncbi:hypothetical protein, partial [Klebsiella variicola]
MADNFPIVLRGYDKERVDDAFMRAQENTARLREQIKIYDARILELDAQLQEEREKNSGQQQNSF